jgi:hypothetical protein
MPRKTRDKMTAIRARATSLRAQGKSLYYIHKTCGVHYDTLHKWFPEDKTPVEPLGDYSTLGVEGLIEEGDILCLEEGDALWQVRASKEHPSGWSAQEIVSLYDDGKSLLGEEVRDLRDCKWLRFVWSRNAEIQKIQDFMREGKSITPRSIVRATFPRGSDRVDFIGALSLVTEILVGTQASWVNIDTSDGLSVVFQDQDFTTDGKPDPDKVAGYLMENGCDDAAVDLPRIKSMLKVFSGREPQGLTQADLDKISINAGLPTWYPLVGKVAVEMGLKIF